MLKGGVSAEECSSCSRGYFRCPVHGISNMTLRRADKASPLPLHTAGLSSLLNKTQNDKVSLENRLVVHSKKENGFIKWGIFNEESEYRQHHTECYSRQLSKWESSVDLPFRAAHHSSSRLRTGDAVEYGRMERRSEILGRDRPGVYKERGMLRCWTSY